ncbi:putative target SNARE coiled-coil domain-containing protein [Arabidopsis thaliana]
MLKHDEALDMLEETVMRVKHNALVMNEQIGLQTRLIDGLDHHVDVSDSGVRVIHIRA